MIFINLVDFSYFFFTISSKFIGAVELRNRAAALELERNSAAKFGSSLSRSRSAQSLKLLGDTATQVDFSFNSIFLYKLTYIFAIQILTFF